MCAVRYFCVLCACYYKQEDCTNRWWGMTLVCKTFPSQLDLALQPHVFKCSWTRVFGNFSAVDTCFNGVHSMISCDIVSGADLPHDWVAMLATAKHVHVFCMGRFTLMPRRGWYEGAGLNKRPVSRRVLCQTNSNESSPVGSFRDATGKVDSGDEEDDANVENARNIRDAEKDGHHRWYGPSIF